MIAPTWKRSPWEVDPLNWFAAPSLPLVAIVLTIVHSTALLSIGGQAGSRWWVQLIAVVVVLGALTVLHLVTRARRGPLTVPRALIVGALLVSATAVSALGYSGEVFSVELWWAPLACSLGLLAMSPYLSALRMAATGVFVLVGVSITTVFLVVPDDPSWPPYTTVAMAILPTLFGVLGGLVIIVAITTALERWSERPLERPTAMVDDPAVVAQVDAVTSARIAEARSLVASVVQRRLITRADAEKARRLAERLRSQLAADIEQTWLDRVAIDAPLIISDPDRLADRLDLAQRAALRALLDAVVAEETAPLGPARLTIRDGNDGIVVIIRIASTRPERKVANALAPHYAGLQTVVRDLRWGNGPQTTVEFTVPAGTAGALSRVSASAPRVTR